VYFTGQEGQTETEIQSWIVTVMIIGIKMRTVTRKMMKIEIDMVMIVAKEGIRDMIIRDILIQIRGEAEKIQTDEAKDHRTVVLEMSVMGEKWLNQER
jgi:hypothetical protein